MSNNKKSFKNVITIIFSVILKGGRATVINNKDTGIRTIKIIKIFGYDFDYSVMNLFESSRATIINNNIVNIKINETVYDFSNSIVRRFECDNDSIIN